MLFRSLVTISKAAAPMIPFMTEQIYRNLVCSLDPTAPESVHLCDFPEVNEDFIDTELEEYMETVLKIVVMGRACRNGSGIKNRQPIGQMFVKSEVVLPEFYQSIIADELNVKKVAFTDDVRSFTSYSFKPQMRTVGPKYGKLLGKIKGILADLDGNKAMDELNETGSLKFDVDGNEVVLTKDDLLIDTAQIPGFVSEQDKNITVVLDTNLTPELIEEGLLREVASKVQTMRKEADFQITDHIIVYAEGSEEIAGLLKRNTEAVKEYVLADDVVTGSVDGYTKEWNINGHKVTLGVKVNK